MLVIHLYMKKKKEKKRETKKKKIKIKQVLRSTKKKQGMKEISNIINFNIYTPLKMRICPTHKNELLLLDMKGLG